MWPLSRMALVQLFIKLTLDKVQTKHCTRNNLEYRFSILLHHFFWCITPRLILIVITGASYPVAWRNWYYLTYSSDHKFFQTWNEVCTLFFVLTLSSFFEMYTFIVPQNTYLCFLHCICFTKYSYAYYY